MGSRTRAPDDTPERSPPTGETTGVRAVFTELGETVDARPPIPATENAPPPSLADPSLADPSLADPSLADPSRADPPLAGPSLADPSLAEPAFELPRARSQGTGQLFGRYRLLKRLAMGGMGEIHLARQEGVGGFEKLLVIKRLLSHLRGEREQVKMFFDEARLQALMSDRHIVQIFDMGEALGEYFIAMEYVHGVSWRGLLDKLKQTGQRLHPAHAVALAVQVARGLSYAHNVVDASGKRLDIVHRDINPQNLLTSFDGECKIIDFGIAKSQLSLVHTEAGTIKGKFAYMSPEQAAAEKLDRRSDLFSLGICLYELLAGKNPFHRENLVLCLDAIVHREVPPLEVVRPDAAALSPLVERCLAKKREERFSDCAELAEALTQLYADGLCGEPPAPLGAFLRELFAAEIEEHLRLLEETGTSGMVLRPGATGSGPSLPASAPAPRFERSERSLPALSRASARSPRDSSETRDTGEGEAVATKLEPPSVLTATLPSEDAALGIVTPEIAGPEIAGPEIAAQGITAPGTAAIAAPTVAERPASRRAPGPLAVGAIAGLGLGALAIAALLWLGEGAPSEASAAVAVTRLERSAPKASAPGASEVPKPPPTTDALEAAAPALPEETGPNVEGANVEGANVESANVEGANVEGANVEGANVEGADEDASLEPAFVEEEPKEPVDKGARRRRAKRRLPRRPSAAEVRAEQKPERAEQKPERAVFARLSVNAGGPWTVRSGGMRRTNTAALPLYEGERRSVRIGGEDAPLQVTLTLEPRSGGATIGIDSTPWSVVRVDNIGRGRTPVGGLKLGLGERVRLDLKSPKAEAPMQITLRLVPEGG